MRCSAKISMTNRRRAFRLPSRHRRLARRRDLDEHYNVVRAYLDVALVAVDRTTKGLGARA